MSSGSAQDDTSSRVSMNTPEVEALFAQTLLGDFEDEAVSDAVATLHQGGSREIFDRAAAWCASDVSLKRARAAAIVCQLRQAPFLGAPDEKPEWIFHDESFSLVTEMLEDELDFGVIESAIFALGHLDNPRAIPTIIRYQDHTDAKVRFAVAFALGCFPNDLQSVKGLLKLTSDADPDVRDWAVFGVGVQGGLDSPEIRETLLRCLDDVDKDVREEAAHGLGKRQDQRLIPKLREMLDEPKISTRLGEAASALLGLDEDPPEWLAADYKAALISKFQIVDWA